MRGRADHPETYFPHRIGEGEGVPHEYAEASERVPGFRVELPLRRPNPASHLADLAARSLLDC